jgi:hypothetical protein
MEAKVEERGFYQLVAEHHPPEFQVGIYPTRIGLRPLGFVSAATLAEALEEARRRADAATSVAAEGYR